jgi:23S rRNA (adenine1618-N6)-methyltransferase
VIPAAGNNESFLSQTINNVLNNLDLQWLWKPSLSTGVGRTNQDVWSRSARRKAARKEIMSEDITALVFKVQLVREHESVDVHIRWLQGRTSVLFESFCGMMKRKIAGN